MPSTSHSYRVEAVILRHMDWGEADRILTLFTLQKGKLRAIAKGVRKPKSRKAGHLEPVSRVTLQLAKGRDLEIITQAETVEPYLEIKSDLTKLGYATYLIELTDRFTYDEGENAGLYHLLVEGLNHIRDESNLFVPIRYFELHLLDLVGYRPELLRCVVCRKEIQPEDQYFSIEKGGVLCPSCGRNEPDSQPITMLALKYLRHLQRSGYAEASRISPTPGTQREMENLLYADLKHYLSSGLRSVEFIRKMKNVEK